MRKHALPIFSKAAWLCGLLLSGCFVGCHSNPAPSSGSSGSGASSDLGGSGGHGAATGGGHAEATGGGAGDAIAPSSACRAEPDFMPSFPSVVALDPDLVARAAAVVGSCMPDDGVARNATHLWHSHLAAPRIYYRLVEQLACLANATCGCAAVEHCLGWVYREEPADCENTCTGDLFTGCGDGVQIGLDCSRLGLSCDLAAMCATEVKPACDGSVAPACTPQGEVAYCDDGAWHETPCESVGFKCVAGKCVGEGASCSETISGDSELISPVATGCSGNTLLGCLGGQSTRIDCATQGPGFGCQSRDGAFFCGLAADCLPAASYSASASASCQGTILSFCNAGRLEHLDCAELGFSGCEIDRKVDHYGCTPGMALQPSAG